MDEHKYFTRKRARFKSLYGNDVNLPYGTRVLRKGDVLFFEGKPLTYISSQNAFDYFVQDDDGFGKKRSELVNAITKILSKRDQNYQKRWDRVWSDDICNSLKTKDYKDHWLWDRSFYDAPIFILEHIKGLVTKED